MSESAKRVRHLVQVPQSVFERAPALFERVTAEEFAREMRGHIREAVEALVRCADEEQRAGEAMLDSGVEIIEGPAETARKRFKLRQINKFQSASRFVELTSLMLHKALGEGNVSSDQVGTGLEQFELVQVAAVNELGRRVKARGGM